MFISLRHVFFFFLIAVSFSSFRSLLMNSGYGIVRWLRCMPVEGCNARARRCGVPGILCTVRKAQDIQIRITKWWIGAEHAEWREKKERPAVCSEGRTRSLLKTEQRRVSGCQLTPRRGEGPSVLYASALFTLDPRARERTRSTETSTPATSYRCSAVHVALISDSLSRARYSFVPFFTPPRTYKKQKISYTHSRLSKIYSHGNAFIYETLSSVTDISSALRGKKGDSGIFSSVRMIHRNSYFRWALYTSLPTHTHIIFKVLYFRLHEATLKSAYLLLPRPLFLTGLRVFKSVYFSRVRENFVETTFSFGLIWFFFFFKPTSRWKGCQWPRIPVSFPQQNGKASPRRI